MSEVFREGAVIVVSNTDPSIAGDGVINNLVSYCVTQVLIISHITRKKS